MPRARGRVIRNQVPLVPSANEPGIRLPYLSRDLLRYLEGPLLGGVEPHALEVADHDGDDGVDVELPGRIFPEPQLRRRDLKQR